VPCRQKKLKLLKKIKILMGFLKVSKNVFRNCWMTTELVLVGGWMDGWMDGWMGLNLV
jgi:hypothetical protein